MPFLPPLAKQSTTASTIAELWRTSRDLVAMSMLPATWKDHEPPQIVDDLARSLASMVGADIVGTTALAGDDASSLRLAFASSDVGDRADIIKSVAARVAGIHPETATDDVVAISSSLGMIARQLARDGAGIINCLLGSGEVYRCQAGGLHFWETRWRLCRGCL